MEKIKELFQLAVEYCKAEPFHAAIVGGLAVFILIILMVIIGLSAKRSKAKKAAKKAAAIKAATPAETKSEAKTAVPAAPAKETTVEKAEVPVKTAETESATAAVQTPPPQPIPEQEAKEDIQPAPAPIVKEEAPIKAKEQPKARNEQKPEIKTQVKPAPKNAAPAATVAKAEGKAETKPAKKTETDKLKEGTMLHDELKDINTDLDFYEEDETDRVARYSGKWVVCRVVTEDRSDEEMYFFELHASNGEKLLSSEEYTTYNGAIRGIETHKSNILRGNFRITLSKRGDYIFKLLNGKGMLLCMGEHYATKARCESAIESAKRFARTAFVDENIQDQVVKVPVEDDTAVEPLAEGYNGKWVIDCNTSAEGEKVFFFELFANNGERLLSSEEYASYIGAVNGIQTHKHNIEKGNFRIMLTKHGDYIYKLLNGNGQLLCLGEHYKTKRRCLNAVESVKRFAASSPILTDPELTK